MRDFKSRNFSGSRSSNQSFGSRDNRGVNRNSQGGGRDRNDRGNSRSFGGGNRGRFSNNQGNRRPTEKHDVICAKCGKKTTVPFKPNSDKPVYCRDCFDTNNNSRGNDKNRNSSSFSGVSIEKFNELNEKVDKILKILNDKGIFESDIEEVTQEVKD